MKKGRNIVARPDSLVEARFSLSAKQNDFIDILLSEMSPDDGKLEYEIELIKYKHYFPEASQGNFYRDIKKVLDKFKTTDEFVAWDEKKQKLTEYVWFTKKTYDYGNGQIFVKVDDEFKSLLLDMKRAAYYKLEFPLSLVGVYSKRLYYMFKQFEDTGFRVDELCALREKLQCPKSYEKYSSFKVKVLITAIAEINACTDIIVEFLEIYKKNKVVRIEFRIKKKKIIDGEELHTSLEFTNEQIAELVNSTGGNLPEEFRDRGEEYVVWTANGINPENVKNKKAYIKKVLGSDKNLGEFIKHLNEEKAKEVSKETRAKSLESLAEAEESLKIERGETTKRVMEERGVESIEELHSILADIYPVRRVGDKGVNE